MRSLGLAAALVVAACGGGAGTAALPSPRPPATASAMTATGPAQTAPVAPSSAPTSTSGALPMLPLAARPEMKSPVPSSMSGDLQGLALDSMNLPPIERLEPRALRGVMKLMAKSLGAKCGDCHLERDFAARTPRKAIAAKMWDEFVVKLAFRADDAPLFCDSCHQGQTGQLDRSDKKALEAWMSANFVEKLKRKDEKDHGCKTCHTESEMPFLNQWGGGGPLYDGPRAH